ncbi:MAG: trypsin-like peptidase domain-containing protein [Planctomycetota bacterium]|nr:MAG: trypsin-like peptidase domain-containing protein [Planctomycetota bacterium]
MIGMQRYFEALQSAEDAISIKSDFSLAHLNKGRALSHVGRYEEALNEFYLALSAGGLNKRDIDAAKTYRLCTQLELGHIKALERPDSERLQLALGGVPVMYLERGPQSEQDPYWYFGSMLYVSDISPAAYLRIDDTDFTKSQGAKDYVRTKTDTGYEASYKLVNQGGYLISIQDTVVVKHEELKILTSSEVTLMLNANVTDIYTEEKLQAYDGGTLIRGRLRVSKSYDASTVIARCHRKATSYLAWLGSKGLSGTITSKAPPTATGFAVSYEGHIITSYHLVKDASQIRVRFEGEDWVAAKVDRYSESDDVAVLRVDKARPNYLKLCDFSGVQQGEIVFTLGYPVAGVLGDEPASSLGTISSLSGITGEDCLIQISALVQPGNSGGPLVGLSGDVVGMVISTTDIRAFFKETGTLPWNVDWAVKSDYIIPLLPEEHTRETDIESESAEANPLDIVRRSICLVEAR